MKFFIALLLVLIAQPYAHAGLGDQDTASDDLPKVPEGFEVTLFAREPLVRNPCSMAFDARGRLFIGMGPQYRNPKPETPGDSVCIIEDTNGDGVADSKKVFATGFNAIQGMAWHGRDLWLANSPDLTVVRDLDGDDVADEYVRVFTDLGNIEHALHGLVWAPDGRLYMSKGNSKGLALNDYVKGEPERVAPRAFRDLWGATGPKGAPEVTESKTFKAADYKHTYQDPRDDWGQMGGVLRFDEQARKLEIVSRGLRNPWDINLDHSFHFLGTDNDQNQGDRIIMPFMGANFGWGHAWSADWTGADHLPTVPISGPVFQGSGTGVVFADSPAWPASHRRVWIINDWLRKTTFLYRPVWQGALLQPQDGEWQPFIEGKDALYRPVDTEFGSDGALYILGWGRSYGLAVDDKGEMNNEGRVFRVTAKGSDWREALPPALANASLKDVVACFDTLIPARRVEAQQELVRRADTAAMMKLLEGLKLSEAQVTWALWSLHLMARGDQGVTKWFAKHEPTEQTLRILGERGQPNLAALNEKRDLLRFAAIQAVHQAKQAQHFDALVERAAAETERLCFYVTYVAMRDLGGKDKLLPLLKDQRGGVRCAALLGLLDLGAIEDEAVKPLLADADARVQRVAKLAVGQAETMLAATVAAVPITLTAQPKPTSQDEAMAMLAQGDAKRGAELFFKKGGCTNCHRRDDQGTNFGPDLTKLGDRMEPKFIVQSILDPNAVITEGFNSHLISTADRSFFGILLQESGKAVALGLINGQVETINKSQMTKHEVLPTSPMPLFASLLSPKDVADVVAFLRDKTPSKVAQLSFNQRGDELDLRCGETTLATWFSKSDLIKRPFFAQVRSLSGAAMTRPYPASGDKQTGGDHHDMHPGIWLGFGDINGTDFWRNQGRIEQVKFTEEPTVQGNVASFTVLNRLLDPKGEEVCKQTLSVAMQLHPQGWVMHLDTELWSHAHDLTLGPQEEMGLGIRVAPDMIEKAGGVVRNNLGDVTAKSAWGKQADWWDYSSKDRGILALALPSNTLKCWGHTRDYGVMVINPSLREPMDARITIPKSERVKLSFDVLIHEGAAAFDAAAAAKSLLAQ